MHRALRLASDTLTDPSDQVYVLSVSWWSDRWRKIFPVAFGTESPGQANRKSWLGSTSGPIR